MAGPAQKADTAGRECRGARPRERTNPMPNVLRKEAEDTFEPRAFLGRIGAGKAVEHYVKNQKIYSQGDAAAEVFFIQKGRVKLTVLSEHGKEAVGGILEEGPFFREA